MSNEQVRELIDRFSSSQNLKLIPMTVADDSPLRVYLNHDTTVDVAARSLTGEPLTAGATGFALWAPPMEPLVFSPASDTGWVNVSYQSGFTSANGGQLAYRRIGKQVFLRGGADKGSDYTTTASTVAVLPTEARPGQTERYASYGAGGRIGRVEIETNGNVNVAVPNLLNSPDEPFIWMGLSHTYLTS